MPTPSIGMSQVKAPRSSVGSAVGCRRAAAVSLGRAPLGVALIDGDALPPDAGPQATRASASKATPSGGRAA